MAELGVADGGPGDESGDDCEGARGIGDDEFAELVRSSYPVLLSVARRYTGNDHDAADALQDGFLRAWRARVRFRGECAPLTWLYEVCMNAARSLASRRAVHRERLDSDEQLVDRCADPDIGPDGWAVVIDLHERALAAVRELAPNQQEVIVRRLAGLPYEDVAADLGISRGAARVRGHRARTRLKAAFDLPDEGRAS